MQAKVWPLLVGQLDFNWNRNSVTQNQKIEGGKKAGDLGNTTTICQRYRIGTGGEGMSPHLSRLSSNQRHKKINPQTCNFLATSPPQSMMRARSSGSVGLWSVVIGIAFPSLPQMTRLSPTFPTWKTSAKDHCTLSLQRKIINETHISIPVRNTQGDWMSREK